MLTIHKYLINFRDATTERWCCGNCKHAAMIFHVRFWCEKFDMDLPSQYDGTVCRCHV